MMTRKNVLSTLLVSGACVSASFATDVYINVQELFGNTKEGKTILAQNEKDKESIFALEYQESQKINSYRESVEKQMREGKIAENDLQDKKIEMARLQKNAKRVIEDKREDVEAQAQQRMLAYKTKLFDVAQKVLENEGWDSIRDKNAPGMICVASNNDKTPIVLKAVNEAYDKDRAKSSVVNTKKS